MVFILHVLVIRLKIVVVSSLIVIGIVVIISMRDLMD